MSQPSKSRDFVRITGDVYSFYQGNAHVISIKCEGMTPELLEEYRANHRHIFRDMDTPPDVA